MLKLRNDGRSLRGIAEDLNLSLSTVRTIVDRKNGTDRTTLKHLQRVDPEQPEGSPAPRRKGGVAAVGTSTTGGTAQP